jgi:Icc protein
MLIAHLSDFHLFADKPETSLVRLDVEEACRTVVDDVVAFDPEIDLCLITGDLTDGGSAKDYELLLDVIGQIRAPVLVVPGNHDRRDGLREAFRGRLPFESDDTLDYEMRFPGLRVLALDTLIEGRTEGRLSGTQLQWLRHRLATQTDGLTLIMMHHPAFPSSIPSLDRMALVEGRTEFAEIVASYGRPLRLFAGHIHRPFQAIWQGASCFVAGSPAFQHRLVLDPNAPEPKAVEEPYAYFLHSVERPDIASVHTRYVLL